MIAFYIDENLAPAISDGLRARGVDCVGVRDEKREGQSDEQVLERAVAVDRVVVTADFDFFDLAKHWINAGLAFAGVLFVDRNTLTIGQIIQELEWIAMCGVPADLVGQVWRIPL